MDKTLTNKRLPTEILEIIFMYTPHNNLKECMYVCVSWYLAAKKEFYKHTTIFGRQCGSKFIACLEWFEFGTYIQYLTITSSVNERRGKLNPPFRIPHENFTVFDKCPNILQVNTDNINPYYILRSLEAAPSQLRKLEKINVYWTTCIKQSPSVRQWYFLANFAHKDSIKYIEIPPTNRTLWAIYSEESDKEVYKSNFPSAKLL